MSGAAIRALVSGYPRRLWGEKLLVMLQAYCDDSIASSGAKPLYLAAYVMEAERWVSFSDAWDAVLRAPPAIDYFKMAEAVGRWECFEGFSETERNKKVFALAEIIREYGPWCMHVRVNTDEFNQILKPHAPPPFRTPYFVLCYAIINGIARIHEDMKVKAPCEFIFDDHPGLAAKVLPIFDFMMDDRPGWPELVAGKPSFKDDKDVLPLQACDMLAWAVRRREEGMATPDFADLLDIISPKDTHFESAIVAETMQSVADHWRQSAPGFATINKRDWDALMERLHNSRALAIALASRPPQ